MHEQLPKIFCFISGYEETYIKRLPKNIAIIYRNYNNKLNKEFVDFAINYKHFYIFINKILV